MERLIAEALMLRLSFHFVLEPMFTFAPQEMRMQPQVQR